MHPTRYVVTTAESPKIFQVDYRSTIIGLAATTTGGTYTIEFTRSPLNTTGVTPLWFAVSAAMTAATTDQAEIVNAITAIRVTTATAATEVDIVATLDY